MAAAAHVTINLYGLAFGNPPFQGSAGEAAFSNVKVFPKAIASSIPVEGVSYHPLLNGYLVTNNDGSFYMYSVIEVSPTGLNVNADKYLSDQSVTTLATAAG